MHRINLESHHVVLQYILNEDGHWYKLDPIPSVRELIDRCDGIYGAEDILFQAKLLVPTDIHRIVFEDIKPWVGINDPELFMLFKLSLI